MKPERSLGTLKPSDTQFCANEEWAREISANLHVSCILIDGRRSRGMIFVGKQQNQWIVMRAESSSNKNIATEDTPPNTSPFRTRFHYWTGEQWVSQHAFAKAFTTEIEARAYLQENRETLEE